MIKRKGLFWGLVVGLAMRPSMSLVLVLPMLAINLADRAEAQVVPIRTPVTTSAQAQVPEPNREGMRLVGKGDLSGAFEISGQKTEARGRVSLALSSGRGSSPSSQVQVDSFNVIFFDVDQGLVGGKEARGKRGLVGFAIDTREPQYLERDASTGRLSGQVRGRIDAAYMASLPAEPMKDAPGDVFITPTQPAVLSVELSPEATLSAEGDEPSRVRSALRFSIQAEEVRGRGYYLPAFKLEHAIKPHIDLEIGQIALFEFAQRLCVQPVRVEKGCLWWKKRTGPGLAFGQPGANAQWAKADVVLSWRDWKTVRDSDHWELASTTDENSYRAEVTDDDCIEVFFTNDFDPEDKYGGGATWGSGTATAQVISSDANAREGVDFTHLAHELGHVLGLLHPGSPARTSAVAGSSNTLMCPSGFANDNPARNSQENEDLLSNPLLTISLKRITVGPDCDDSADCGACP